MPIYFNAFFVAMITSLIITPLVIILARKTNAMDSPNDRKIHDKPIPRIGGLGIYLSFMVTIFFIVLSIGFNGDTFNEAVGLILSGSLILVIGLIDDYKNLSAKIKFIGQICVAMILVLGFDLKINFINDPFGDYIYLEWFAIPATIFWLVGLTNTINLIDGIDGLAAGVAAIASSTIFLVALDQNLFLIAILTASLAGASCGFLKYNFHPAKIFMGDSGSMFLGFMLAGVSVTGSIKSVATIAFIVPIFALGLPILDTTFAIVRRLHSGIPIFKPDKGHLHHRLLSIGYTQRQAVILMYIISALFSLSALALLVVNSQTAIVILALIFFVIVYGVRKLRVFKTDS